MLVVAFLSVLSFANGVKAFQYEATGVLNGLLAVLCIYAAVFLVLFALIVLALVVAVGNRLPYVPLVIAILLYFFALLARIAEVIIGSDVDPFDDISGDAFVATLGIYSLFSSWSIALVFLAFSHLIKVRADNVLRSSGNQAIGLNPLFTIAYFAAFVLIFIFATTTSGLYIDYLRAIYDRQLLLTIAEINKKGNAYMDVMYAFSAIWYASSIFLGVFAFLAYRTVQQAGITDKVLKVLLFGAFPIHVLHVLEDFAFVIVFSPSGIKEPVNHFTAVESAALAETILAAGFHAGTILVLIILGVRRSNWLLGGEKGNLHPSYPMQGNIMLQGTYQPQTQYTHQATYPAQNQYDSNAHLNPQE